MRAAELRHSIDEMKSFGISVGDVSVDVPALVKRSRNVAARLSSGVTHVLKKNKVPVIEATAKIGRKLQNGREMLLSDGTTISAGHVVIATGARAKSLPGIEPDGTAILTYREAMVPQDMPKSLIIVGSGAIGAEFASFYDDMGVEVTLIEALDRILPVEDEEVSAYVARSFEKRGMKIKTNVKLQSVSAEPNGVTATLAGDQAELQADRMILAVGITGNVEDLGVDDTAVKINRGHIVTDGFGATDEPGIYAIGDVTGPPWLAHKASHEALSVLKKLLGLMMAMQLPMALCRDAFIAVPKWHLSV